MNFNDFKTAVAKQFALMMSHDLFVVDIEGDALWDTYINSFPEGTNLIYRERTEHDCSCCKSFIRAVGKVVALIDGKMVSIWDGKVGDPNYQVVSGALAALVKSKPIANIFFHFEPQAGVDKNFEQMVEGIKTWEHFHVQIPARFVDKNPGTKLSEAQASHDVLKRGLEELTFDAMDTIIELIGQNSLYRGEEHRAAVVAFRKVMEQYADRPDDLFVWANVQKLGGLCRFRNSAIGTLATDLSTGVPMEDAVKMFESKVAPANYKRPTALVTKQMVEQAKAKIAELDLTASLERRYANINDVTINNVLFANRDARKSMAGDVFDDITSSIPSKQKFDKVEEVGIEKFLSDILPGAKSIELMPENKHTGNLVSLIAPANPTARHMFKWGNAFSWSYNGEMADSIKERVKAAGGNVTGDVCCRLAWGNSDDLDFHMQEPDGSHIYFGNKQCRSRCGGILDVDANGMDGIRENPVENIFYAQSSSMVDGAYRLVVNQYNRRHAGNFGFEVEVDIMGTVHTFIYDKPMRSSESVAVAVLNVKKGVVEVVSSLPSTQRPKEVWNIHTNTFVPVNVVMMSPNYWDGQGVGNKHYFFMLEGCRNDGKARGFFNEFLVQELDAHRKVIEIVGGRLKIEDSQEQLSGLGFSSTQRNSVLCRVNGAFSRVIKLTF